MRPAAGPRRAVTKLKCVVSQAVGSTVGCVLRSHRPRAEHSPARRLCGALRGVARIARRLGGRASWFLRPGLRVAAHVRSRASRVVARGAGSARDEPATAATREAAGAAWTLEAGASVSRVSRPRAAKGATRHARDASGSSDDPSRGFNARLLRMVYAYTDLPRPYSALPRANSVRPAKKQDHLMNNQHRTVSIDL